MPPQWEDLLDADERARAAGFRFGRDRTHFVAAHALTRRMLAAFSGEDAKHIRFEYSAFGRPEMARRGDVQPPRFSLTHTRGLVACAVTRSGDIGLDAECVQRETNIDLADRFFTRAEADWLRQCPARTRQYAFLELWTLKEAYAKARGLGLSLKLNSFQIMVDPPRLLAADDDAHLGWTLAQIKPTPDHVLAIACRFSPPISTRFDVRQISHQALTRDHDVCAD